MREFDALRRTLAGSATTALFDVPWTPLYLFVAFLIHPVLGLLVFGAGFVLVMLAITERTAQQGQVRTGASGKRRCI